MLGYLAIHGEPCSILPNQCTPLYLAAERGHVDAVKCLAEQGADMNIKTTHGVSK